MRAVHQGGQGRDQMDAAVVPFLRSQRGSPAAPCSCLQPRQLHANPGDAENRGAVVADQPEGEVDQDRREGHEPRPLRYVPDGRSRRVAADVRGYPDADRPAAGIARASMRGGWVRYDKRRRERCVSMQPIQSVSAPRPGQKAGSTSFLQPMRYFLLPKTPRRAEPDSATAVNPGNVGLRLSKII